MRGKSNVPIRKAPVINGVLENMTVASGNTIKKGDFVQYEMQESDKNISSTLGVMYYHRQYNLGNGRFLCGEKSNLVKLISVKEGYSELSSAVGTFFCLLNDGNVAVLNSDKITIYDISGGKFQKLSDFTVEKHSTARASDGSLQTPYAGLCQVSSGEIIYVRYASYTSSSTTWEFNAYDYSDGEIENKLASTTENLTSNNYIQDFVVFDDGYFYAVFVRTGNNSGETLRVQYSDASFAFENTGKNISQRFYNNSLYSTTSCGANCFANNILDSMTLYYLEKDNITSIMNFVGGDGDGYSGTLTKYCSSFVFLNESKILVCVAYGQPSGSPKRTLGCFYLIDFDLETKTGVRSNVVQLEITYTLNITNTALSNTIFGLGTGMIDDGNIYYVWDARGVNSSQQSYSSDYSGKYLLKLFYNNGKLYGGSPSGYVEKFDGGNAIGFANSGGSGGDVIGVWKPQISS